MTRSWPGYLPAMLAAPVTLMLTAVYAAVAGGSEVISPLRGVVMLLLIPAPLGVAVMWGGVLLACRPHVASLAGAVVWFLLSYFLLPQDVVWQLAGSVAAGLAAGLALGLRWRFDAAVAVVAAALLPVMIWAVVQVPVQEQVSMVSDEMMTVIEDNLPEGASSSQRTQALDKEKLRLDQISGLAVRIYPFVIGIGLLGQGVIILVLILFVARRLGIVVPGWALPPFYRWRLPFYLVWLLVAGIGLMLTRAPYLASAGLNLTLLAAFVVSVQGIAVQWHVTNRMLSNIGRVFYWLVMGVFFSLLILVSGVVLGLLDQWVDLRRLNVDSDIDGNDQGPNDIE